MKTVGLLAKEYGLSRSTLLYYDRIGLLCPSLRNSANYRLYSNSDVEKLEMILTYRKAGLPLEEIGGLLQAKPVKTTAILGNRLEQLNREIEALRNQQQMILRLIGEKTLSRKSRVMDKASWVKLLRATGMDEEDMIRWHFEFEKAMPEMHQDFLESLGIEKAEIRKIRKESKKVLNGKSKIAKLKK